MPDTLTIEIRSDNDVFRAIDPPLDVHGVDEALRGSWQVYRA